MNDEVKMNFNDAQMSAIDHKDGPMLVLAGPGSGKTATLVERTKNLILHYGVNPSNILVITFTRAAAKEMEQRFLREMIPFKTESSCTGSVTFGTFHAIFFKILKMAYSYNSSNIVSEEIKYQAIQELIRRYGLDSRDENELISGILSEISMIKNSYLSLEEFDSSQCKEDVFRKIFFDYERFLKKHRLIDFDDMLTLTYELFQQRPDILKAFQKKYQYILVDEFQDINQIQYDVIRMLAQPENNLFMVGDDDQSIYRFRGSKPEIMLHVPKDYPNLKQIQLEVNYRCPKEIIEVSQKVIANNKDRFPKKMNSYKKVCYEKEEKDSVRFLHFSTQYEEVLYLIKEIETLLSSGQDLSDIAILYRTNLQPRFLMEQLMAYNINFKSKEKIPNLYDHWIVKDIRAYMNIAKGSCARTDFLMIMNKPKRYISRDSLYGEEVSFEEWLKIYEDKPWIAEQIEKLYYDIKMLKNMSPYAAINFIRHGIGYDDYILDYANYRNCNKEDLFDVLDEVQASAKGFKTLKEWENHIEAYTEEVKNNNKQKNKMEHAVTLSTLHSAKGLEYQYVYIIDANQDVMPYKKAILDKDVEEERRLFYVGLTRASQRLTLCAVKELHNREMKVSQFVKEAGFLYEEDVQKFK